MASRIVYAHLATVSLPTHEPAITRKVGWWRNSTSASPSIPRTERARHLTPPRTHMSSSARICGASGSSSSRDASPRRIDTGRDGGDANRIARDNQSVPHCAANAQAAESGPFTRTISSMLGRSTCATDRSTERSASVASIARSARSRSNDINAPTSEFVSAARPSRARDTAEEIDSPSCRASRRDASSPWVYNRWRPLERCGCGKPNRRSHARKVFGLTFSKAAASLVLSRCV